jgi:GTP-binding protein LepA
MRRCIQVFNQRLQDEFNMGVVTTTPSVPYIIRFSEGAEKIVSCVSEWPVGGQNVSYEVFEPYVKVTLISPSSCYGDLADLIKEKRGTNLETTYLEDGSILLASEIPWAEVVCDMNDQVKHLSAGYASFNYEDIGYRSGNLVKVEIAVNGDACDPLSFVTHADKADSAGRKIAIRLKETLTRQQFEIVIQARVGAKVCSKKCQT